MTPTEITVGPEPLDVAKPEAEDVELYSVTTVIGVMEKPGLVYWAANEAAACAVDHNDAWRSSGWSCVTGLDTLEAEVAP